MFRFLTARACFVPAVQCSAESEDGSLYSLEVLRGTEWEIPYPGTRSRYSIKVSPEIIAHQVEFEIILSQIDITSLLNFIFVARFAGAFRCLPNTLARLRPGCAGMTTATAEGARSASASCGPDPQVGE